MRGRGPPALGRRDEVLAPARDQRGRALREARRTGFLSMPARNLTEFPKEAYHLEDHMDKDEKKWECVDLVKVDLSHNAIPSIDDEVGGLTTLTSFKLAQNALTTLPEGFFELTGLTYLDLSNNQLRGSLSESFGSFTNLKELGLAANKLDALPESLGRLASLEVLRIEDNVLTKLPSEIGQLKKLHTLTVHSNQLTTLPMSFSGLRNLQTLDMKKNKLETLDEQLATLPLLKYLDLRQNKLVLFPQLPQSAALDQVFLGYNALSQIDESSILRAKDSITVLDLRDNKLTALPVNIACLCKLKTLDLSNNDLSDLPPGLGYLKHLNHMVVDGNPLRSIRRGVISSGCEALKKYLRTRGAPPEGAANVMEQEVDELQLQREREQAVKAAAGAAARPGTSQSSVLRCSIDFSSKGGHIYRDAAASGTLDLQNNVLQTLPAELLTPNAPLQFSATLLHLNLSKNHLTVLPPELAKLHALVSLTVEENHLRSIDSAIASLPHLQFLRLRKNQLSSEAVNAFLGRSQPELSRSLKELDLRNNILTEMPLSIRFLSSLETLQLAFNKLETLDLFPWQELARASVVSVSDNKLRSLGHIYHLPLLASLSFENNNLTSVPCELALCPHLHAIYMNGNPQKTVRGGILAKGSLEILSYLKNKLPPNATLQPPAATTPPPAEPSAPLVVAKTQPVQRHKNLNMYAATSDDSMDDTSLPVTPLAHSHGMAKRDMARPGSPGMTRPDTETSESSISQLDAQIAELESQLDGHALSAAKRFALKKELALARSTRIRLQRRLAA